MDSLKIGLAFWKNWDISRSSFQILLLKVEEFLSNLSLDMIILTGGGDCPLNLVKQLMIYKIKGTLRKKH